MTKQETKQFMVFSYGLPLICFFLAWRQYVSHGLTAWVMSFIIAGIIVVWMAFFAIPLLKQLFKSWMKLAGLIGKIVTVAILTVFYFLIMTPTGIILRLRGKDFMNLRWKDQVDSYWMNREQKSGNYTQQF